MIQGLYAAATGIMAVEDRQAVIANNIANASTAGFRRQQPVTKGFYDVFMQGMNRPLRFNVRSAPGGGVKVTETFTNTAAGFIASTDNPLNVALSGPGFLAVDTPGGDRFTRAGNLTVDSDGQLATSSGLKVQGAGGAPIDVRGSDLQIAEDGTVRVDGVDRGRLRVVEFEDPHMLTREGDTLYQASDAAMGRSAEAAKTRVVNKALEMPNMSLPQEMVSMILGLRAYAANQKVITSFDETMSRLIDQVGMPA